MLDDLYRYNDWANIKLLRAGEGLVQEQIEQEWDLGCGSLGASWRHLLSAEETWFRRWRGEEATQVDASPLASLQDVERRLADISEERRQWMQAEAGDGHVRVVAYRDRQGNAYQHRLRDLLLHVVNHGVHHRAQILHFLKRLGRQVPAGVDYIFFRLAHPAVEQDPETVRVFRRNGLEVAVSPGGPLVWDADLATRYYAYGDWANERLLSAAGGLDNAALDRDFGMGPGSLRKTLLHLFDAEQWWDRNWNMGPGPFPHSPETTPLSLLREQWTTLAAGRNAMIAAMSETDAERIVSATAGGRTLRFLMAESLVQLCTHGTHHRAQILNMLKRSGAAPPPLDYVVWLREQDAAG